MVHSSRTTVKGSKFKNFHQPFKSNILVNSADPGEIPHHAAFLLSLYCVTKLLLSSISQLLCYCLAALQLTLTITLRYSDLIV